MLKAVELADKLGLSSARISQYVSEGKLSGCYSGEGRARRFDPSAVAKALGRRLDVAQMLGNGAETRRALAAMQDHGQEASRQAPKPRQIDGGELIEKDPDRYELARTQKTEEEARKLRRLNAEAEGTFLLASEVERQIARQMAQEVAEFETVLRDGARRVADKLGVDFKTARQIMVDTWRSHRVGRSQQVAVEAGSAGLTEAERDEDI
ncbi:MAG: hypothetical protein Q8Q26_09620 [Pseudorhodobacter sp.]|nr:hypothetical protein [Pseudorhodobacter sp.]